MNRQRTAGGEHQVSATSTAVTVRSCSATIQRPDIDTAPAGAARLDDLGALEHMRTPRKIESTGGARTG